MIMRFSLVYMEHMNRLLDQLRLVYQHLKYLKGCVRMRYRNDDCRGCLLGTKGWSFGLTTLFDRFAKLLVF